MRAELLQDELGSSAWGTGVYYHRVAPQTNTDPQIEPAAGGGHFQRTPLVCYGSSAQSLFQKKNKSYGRTPSWYG